MAPLLIENSYESEVNRSERRLIFAGLIIRSGERP